MVVPEPKEESNGRRRPGVVETMGLAFGMLNRRPYLIWMLIALDLALWLGPRITIVDMFRNMPFGFQQFEQHASDVLERFAEIELLPLLSGLMPTLIDPAQISARPTALDPVQVDTGLGFLIVPVVLLVSLAVFMAYLTVLGRLVSDRPATGIRVLKDSLLSARGSALALIAFVGVIAFMTVPFGVGSIGLWVVGTNPESLLILAVIILTVWLGVFFLFSFPALALGETSVFRAMRMSYQVVQQNFLAVIGLLFVVLVIRAGTPHALSVFMESQWSVPFAIVANAYVATGLIASLMLFFQNRVLERSTATATSTAAARG
jgi:hypothetical protein